MAEQLPAPSSIDAIAEQHGFTDGTASNLPPEHPGYEREEDPRGDVRGLHRWICELLIENQQLRMSLEAALNPSEPGRSNDEYDQDA
jgi:hypothetical protein